MGTALVHIGLRAPFLYQTLALLVFAYMLRFLPLAVGSIAILGGTARHQLGQRRQGVGRRTAGGVAAGVPAADAARHGGGGALVFLEAMRELPATLLLAPTGFETLATYLWRVYEAGYFGRAAVPGLMLVFISGWCSP